MGRIREWWTGETRAEAGGDATVDGGMQPPSRTAAPRSVSVGEALSLPMVYRAIQIHAIAAKQLSIATFRNGRQIDEHPLTRRPDPFTSRAAWIEQAVVSLASTGNAYFEIIRDASGEVASLPVLNPLDVRIQTTRSGRVTSYTYRGVELPASRVQHATLLRVPGTAYGLGPIQAAQPDLRGAIDTRDYASNWFETGGQPNGILKSDQVLTAEAAKAAKTQFKETGAAKHDVLVLGQGLSYAPIFLSPKDVQFIESQNFSVTSIARMLGVPASLMLAAVEGNSQTYANVEQDWLAYVRFTLMGYLVEIEEAISALLPGRQQAKFNIEALLRADTTTRYAAYRTAIEAGFQTINEVRDLEHWAPLTDAQMSTKEPTDAAA
ncbi:phage portal protein [Microbacterium sp. KNMS]